MSVVTVFIIGYINRSGGAFFTWWGYAVKFASVPRFIGVDVVVMR